MFLHHMTRSYPLVSATGSVDMGRHVTRVVADRLGKTILELGGNNAVIVTPRADLDLTVRAILFGAVGTAGQRCTTTRRVIVHKDILSILKKYLIKAYEQVRIGNPLDKETVMGPLIDKSAVEKMRLDIGKIKSQGGKVLYGGTILSGGLFNVGTYVMPCMFGKSDVCSIQVEYDVGKNRLREASKMREKTAMPYVILPYNPSDFNEHRFVFV